MLDNILSKLLMSLFLLTFSLSFSCGKKEDKYPAIKNKQISKHESAVDKPGKTSKNIAGSYKDTFTGIEFVFIKGGCYRMGDIFGDGDSDERPVHKVCVDGFYMSRYETTQAQWLKIREDNPSRFKAGINYPVENVSWNEVQGFIGRLNELTGKRHRLPTEAEWEYAARSRGKDMRFAGFSEEGELSRYANFCDRSCGAFSKTAGQEDKYKNTAPVGRFRPNGSGLYDMTGNVWEWTQDWYDENYYKVSPELNPPGVSSGVRRTIRGGSWDYDPRSLRVSDRDGLEPDKRSNNCGFRLVVPVK